MRDEDKGTGFDFIMKSCGKEIGYDYECPSSSPPRYTTDPTMRAAVLAVITISNTLRQEQR
jgi:hypothetical protein